MVDSLGRFFASMHQVTGQNRAGAADPCVATYIYRFQVGQMAGYKFDHPLNLIKARS